MQQSTAFSGDRVPLTLVVERSDIQVGRWTTPRWQVLGVVAGEHLQPDLAAAVATASGSQCRLWSDLQLSLYKDGAESYWHNLQSKRPGLFVICRPDEDGELQPFMVTADQNEAAAYMEADDTVLPADMPAEVYQWLEQFVIRHYKPQAPKKTHRPHRREDSLYG